MSLDQPEQVLTKYFEHHANVVAVRTFVTEMVQETCAQDIIVKTRTNWDIGHTPYLSHVFGLGGLRLH